MAGAIVWLRNDLRIADNSALAAAIKAGGSVVPVYVLDDEPAGARKLGAASRWWLHHSLARLARDLKALGAPLILRRGPAEVELAEVQRVTGAARVEAHRGYQAWERGQEQRVRQVLGAAGAGLHLHTGNLLFEPDTVETQSGEPFRVFTPYSRVVMRRTVGMPAGQPSPPAAKATRVSGDKLAAWELLPTKPDWAGGLRKTWTPGEAGARDRLAAFLAEALAGYRDDRNRPDHDGTSRLSPHLRFGEIAPARIWHSVTAATRRSRGQGGEGSEAFLRELVWREFSYHLLWHRPDLARQPFRPEFARLAYREDAAGLRAWQSGATGFPIVDAGMRQLWATGYMHNRVRMIAASFLVKDLLIDWREGERWFWDTLVDADPANNAASWQWVAGTGADAAPFFRIFNPVKQGVAFDPDGTYVRRWVPELKGLAGSAVHAPWLVPEHELTAAGVVLGETYPLPIVDHVEARRRALAAFASIKGNIAVGSA